MSNDIAKKRDNILGAIKKAEVDAANEARKAKEFEQRACNLREQAKFTVKRMQKLADIQDSLAKPHREAESAHRARADRLKADLAEFDNSTESMTVEERLAALEARLR